jgi:MerR family transcriptional regulator, light-induced transcriptional regulator
MLLEGLLQAVAALDADEGGRILDEALATCAVETVCLGLLHPLVTRASELSDANRLSPAAEQLASLLVRNRLSALVDALPVHPHAPLVVIACPPGEHHEIGPLMVTLFWRRAGLRALYLGPDVAQDAFIALAREHPRALVCLSAATSAGARQVAHAAAALARLPQPHPLFGYGGSAFVRSPDLQRHVREGYFLGVDAQVATRHIVRMLTDGPVKRR